MVLIKDLGQSNRKELLILNIDHARAGDKIVVWRLDRLGKI